MLLNDKWTAATPGRSERGFPRSSISEDRRTVSSRRWTLHHTNRKAYPYLPGIASERETDAGWSHAQEMGSLPLVGYVDAKAHKPPDRPDVTDVAIPA